MKKLLFPALFALLVSCKEDSPAPVSIGFASATSEAVESGGSQSITITFDRATDMETELSFTISGDAFLNGDYSLVTTSPLIVPAGSTSASIDFNLIDESIIEGIDETIVFTLTSATSGMLNAGGILAHTFTLKDNDQVSLNALQVDLTWDLGEGVDIDLVDLDEVFITNLVENSDGFITDFDTYTASVGENDSGFESIQLVNSAPDDDYYILVVYFEGSQAVDFNLRVWSSSLAGDVPGSFTAADVGSGIIIGPIIKSGDIYSARTSYQSDLQTFSVSEKALREFLSK